MPKRFVVPSKPLNWLVLWWPLFGLCTIPVLATWMENRYQVSVIDLVLPLVLALATSILVTICYFKPFQRNRFAGYLGAIFAITLLGQNFDERYGVTYPILKSYSPLFSPDTYEGMFFTLIYAVIVIILGHYVCRLVEKFLEKKKWHNPDFARAIMIVMGVAIVLQAYPVVKIAASAWPQYFYKPTALASNATTAANKPDIYYIVLDRYTNQGVLNSQLNYDNSPFLTFLQNNQFNVKPDAFSNYPFTTMSISSTLKADYHTDLVNKFAQSKNQTIEPFHETIRNSPVIQTFKSLGYTDNLVGSWYETSNTSPLADNIYQPDGQLTVFGHTYYLNTFSKQLLAKSLFWSVIQHGMTIGNFKILTYGSIGEADATLYKLKTLEDIANQPAGGKFTFAHLLIPHDPYYFNADGSLSTNPGSDNIGKPIKVKYTDQVTYINSEMEELITQINKNTKNQAVIIIQSDEGPYPQFLIDEDFNGADVGEDISGGNMLNWTDQALQMKFGVLAAYHIPQADPQVIATNTSSVNTFRIVLNTYFGAQLPYLPDCHYAYEQGRAQSFVFKEISAKLTGQANAACPADSNFSK